MNLVASTRSKLLLLGSDHLTQAQYETITAPGAQAKDIFRVHDEIFGGNLGKIPDKNLDNGPYVVHDVAVDGTTPSDDAEDGGDEEVSGPEDSVPTNLLTVVTS